MKARHMHVESLECRFLPTVGSFVYTSPATPNDHNLHIYSDRADSIEVACFKGMVHVNGRDADSGPYPCSDVTWIQVIGGPGANFIDLSAVDRDSFPGISRGYNLLTILPGKGNDTVIGSAYGDNVAGSICGLPAVSHTRCNDGRDSFVGGAGPDTLTGGDGNDRIVGGEDDDFLSGGAGNNNLVGGAGFDCVHGLVGVDDSSGGVARLTDSRLTDEGRSRLDGIECGVLEGDNRDDVLDARHFGGPVSLYGSRGDDLLIGSAGLTKFFADRGDDTMIGDSDDYLEAHEDVDFVLSDERLMGLGNDTIVGIRLAWLSGDQSSNFIDAGGFRGDVTLIGNGGDDTLIGGVGADLISGREGHDLLIGNAGDDQLNGDEGDDRLSGGNGDDFLSGGPGCDAEVAEDAEGNFTELGEVPGESDCLVPLPGYPDKLVVSAVTISFDTGQPYEKQILTNTSPQER